MAVGSGQSLVWKISIWLLYIELFYFNYIDLWLWRIFCLHLCFFTHDALLLWRRKDYTPRWGVHAVSYRFTAWPGVWHQGVMPVL